MFLSPAAAAGQRTASFTGVFANIANSSVAGSAVLTGSTFVTAGAAGTGTVQTANKKNVNNPTSTFGATGIYTGTFTAGTGARSTRLTVGMAQTGGQGGWIAVTPDAAVQVAVGGGANGYLEFADLATTASQPLQYQIEWAEN